MAITIGIIGQKGGVGKTTSAINLAGCLVARGKRVLLIDTDGQRSATMILRGQPTQLTQVEMFQGRCSLADLIQPVEQVPGLDLVPSVKLLSAAERVLANAVGVELVLQQEIARLDPQRYDFVLLDCGPNLGLMTIAALAASQSIVVPLEASVLSLDTLADLDETTRIVRDRLNPNLSVLCYVVTQMDTNGARHPKEVVDELRSSLGDRMSDVIIRRSIALVEAMAAGKPIVAYDAKCNGAFDYQALTDDILKRLGHAQNPELQHGKA